MEEGGGTAAASMEAELALAQSLKYAEELRTLYVRERDSRRRAEDALAELERSYGATVRALAAALELRDDATGAHAERVAAVALRLAREVAPDLAADPGLEHGFLLHDIGKIGIPDSILLKPGPLTARERRVMEQHPLLGGRIVARVPGLGELVGQVVVAHHERWDGTGYPHRLAGEEIPLAARIFAVADAFDAMTSDRPYRPSLGLDQALAEIERGGGTQFDPAVAAALLGMADDVGRTAA